MTPEQLAEAGFDVTLYLQETPPEAVICLHDEKVAEMECRAGEPVHAFVTRAYAEATRIAREREGPRVWWVSLQRNTTGEYLVHNPTTPDRRTSSTPYVILDSRVVGETPEARANLLDHLSVDSFSVGDMDESMVARIVAGWLAEIESANAAIAAARKERE